MDGIKWRLPEGGGSRTETFLVAMKKAHTNLRSGGRQEVCALAFIQYLNFDGTDLPLPDSYEVEMNDVEADSGGETEAGTTQRDGFKAKLEKDTSYKGLWTVGFTLKEMQDDREVLDCCFIARIAQNFQGWCGIIFESRESDKSEFWRTDMELNNILVAKNRDELRAWLIDNHNKEKECWVVVKRGRPVDDNIFWYIDAVEEAMCFGWIDSTTKKQIVG